MPSLENRIIQLEALSAQNDRDMVRVIYCETGESVEDARVRSGVPIDFAGKVLAVVFVDSPNSIKEVGHEQH